MKTLTENICKEKLNLVVEFQFLENTENNNICARLWIVHSKLYKIIDLCTFLNFYLHESKTIKLNEKLTYNSKIHTFSRRDKQILKILSTACNSKFNKEKSTLLKSNSQVFLKDNEIVEILKLLEGKKFLFTKDKKRELMYIENKNMPLQFKVKKTSSFLRVSLSTDIPVPLTSNGEYFYFNKTIYNPSISQREAYMPFYNKFLCENTTSITIYKEINEAYYNSFFENMNKCNASILLKEELSYKEKNNFFKTKFYLDFPKDRITLNVKFIYKLMEINPFSNKKYIASHYIQNRSLRDELYILDIIKGLNFQMTNLYFELDDKNEIIEFLQKGIPQLKEFGEIHKSDRFISHLTQN